MPSLSKKLLGLLILVKTFIPIVLFSLFFISSYITVSTVNNAVNSSWQKVSANIDSAMAKIDLVEIEATRILDEVQKIKDSATEFSNELRKVIAPLKTALYGLQNTLKAVTRAIEGVINGVISAVNKVPFVDISKINLSRHLNIPAFLPKFPKLNLDIAPNFTAVEELAVISRQIADETTMTLNTITETILFWWRMFKIVVALVFTWLLLSAFGYVLRTFARIGKGWQLMIGKDTHGGWEML